MNTKYIRFVKTKWFIAILALSIGAAIVLGIRFATYKVSVIHYHANFAVYINGAREEFKGMEYYSEVEMCTLNNAILPSERAHMHDNVNDVVHVEDHAATWGQFFTNLGWTLGPNFIASPNGIIYAENGDTKLHILLNGQDYSGISSMQNTVIKDTDKLLVSYGNEDSTVLNQQFATVSATAKKYDITKDPASCSGNHTTTVHDRLVHMF